MTPTVPRRMSPTKGLPNPTYYVEALNGEFSEWAYCEERAVQYKGKWRSSSFDKGSDYPVDLEIGTGNGYFFAHQAKTHPERGLIGIERKYKPLIQSVRRAVKEGSHNVRGLRYHASYPEDLFAPEELNNVFIHFPDPWPKKRQKKNRLIQKDFIKTLFALQKPGSILDFKTDSRDYFDHAVPLFRESAYTEVGITYDLHRSEYADENFVTHFEKIFLKQQLPIHFIRLIKN